MHLSYETKFDKLDRDFDIKIVQFEEKFKQNDMQIRKNSSRLLSPVSSGGLGNVSQLEKDLKALKLDIMPEKIKKLENELEMKIKDNGNLVAAKVEKKLKDLKL